MMERDVHDFVAEAIAIIATTDDLMDAELAPVFEAYAAQMVAKATAGNPITHNGKEYWPDANGWYDMECCPETTCLIYTPLYKTRLETFPAGIHKDTLKWVQCRPCTGWQPLPPPPITK